MLQRQVEDVWERISFKQELNIYLEVGLTQNLAFQIIIPRVIVEVLFYIISISSKSFQSMF